MHVVLLGDSIFDNAAYVGGGPDVVRQLRPLLPAGARASLLAVDGAVIDDVHRQLTHIPDDATHLVLSAGGNDALGHVGILDETVHSSRETLDRLADIRDAFEHRYRRLLEAVLAHGRATALCTIYEGNFDLDWLQRAAATALTVFNDAILRTAFDTRTPVLDLRRICNRPAHYANPIEPSEAGGQRIAEGIAGLVQGHDFASPWSTIYP